MITKVIGTARGFYDVARYLTQDRETGRERDTGFQMGYNVSPDAMEAAREMAESSRGRLMHQPCLHVVLAPAPAGERLDPAGLDHMTNDLIREMGWQDYQILAAEHLDTDHQHVHLMINRAHPLDNGERIDGYYLYKDLRRWEQDYAERRRQAALEGRSAGQSAAPGPAVGVGERFEEAAESEAIVQEPAVREYEASAPPESSPVDGDRAAGDRLPSDHAAREGTGKPIPESEQPALPAEPGPHRLTDLSTLSEKAGLGREVSTIAELERLAHEKEMALAMLKADALLQKTTGQALLSDEGRSVLQQTAQEIDVILERQQGYAREAASPLLDSSVAEPQPSVEARSRNLHDLIEKSYRDLLAEAQPYWMHPEAALRDMKDLAMLGDPKAVVEAIRHEPEAFNERTAVPMAEVDAERIAEAYHRYETYRQRYVAEVMDRMDLQVEKTPVQPGVSERVTGARLKDPARANANGEVIRSVDPVEQAERLYFKDVASRLLDERIQDVQGELGKATAHAQQFSETVRERAYHHLHTALRETYKDPSEAFKRLEAYHRRGEADLVARKPELLGEMQRTSVRERVRGETPRKRAAGFVRRYGEYVDGPEVRDQGAAAKGRVVRLQEQRRVLSFAQRRVGTPEAAEKGCEEVRKSLTASEQRRLQIRLKHLPGAEVRERSGKILTGALREYPGTVRPGQIKGLASQKAVNQAMGKAARGVGAKMSLKQPLQFAMRAGGLATRAASAVYRSAKVFFER